MSMRDIYIYIYISIFYVYIIDIYIYIYYIYIYIYIPVYLLHDGEYLYTYIYIYYVFSYLLHDTEQGVVFSFMIRSEVSRCLTRHGPSYLRPGEFVDRGDIPAVHRNNM